MFDEKLTCIEVGNKSYPIKIDMYVLEKIQEKYGTVNQFELKVRGLIQDQEDKTKLKAVEPDIAAIRMVLPWMIQEGCDIEGIELELSEKEIIQNITTSFYELKEIILEEYVKCFQSKKRKPKQVKKQSQNQ